MTQISRDSKEITTAVGPRFLDATAGTVTTPGYPSDRFRSCLAYVDTGNGAALGIDVCVECSPDNVTYYRTTQGAAGDGQGNHNVSWTSITGGSSLMAVAEPIGRYTRVSVYRTAGQGNIVIRCGFKS